MAGAATAWRATDRRRMNNAKAGRGGNGERDWTMRIEGNNGVKGECVSGVSNMEGTVRTDAKKKDGNKKK